MTWGHIIFSFAVGCASASVFWFQYLRGTRAAILDYKLFADELIDRARKLERSAGGVRIKHGDNLRFTRDGDDLVLVVNGEPTEIHPADWPLAKPCT